jgi:hypothetical protein
MEIKDNCSFKRICAKAGNERGIALVLVLVVSLIVLAIMSGLIYIVISGTQISGMQKRYKTAQEAASGGADVMFALIESRGNPSWPGLLLNINAEDIPVGSSNCLIEKLNKSTANWNAACDSALSIDILTPTTYDMTFQLGSGANTYTVFAKIADTIEGNSGGDFGLTKGGVVSGSGEITVQSYPYFYTVEIEAQNTASPAERAKYSILYEY